MLSYESSRAQTAVSFVCKTGLTGCLVFASFFPTGVLEKITRHLLLYSLGEALYKHFGFPSIFAILTNTKTLNFATFLYTIKKEPLSSK